MSNSQKSLSRKKSGVEQSASISIPDYPNLSLESYLLDNPTITSEQFREILSYAYRLQDAEINAVAHQRVISDLEIKTQEESKREDNQIEISAMFKVAKDLGLLDNKYVQKALELHAPSQQQIQATLNRLGAKPSYSLIVSQFHSKSENYVNAYINAVNHQLNTNFPHLKFERYLFNEHHYNYPEFGFSEGINLKKEEVREVESSYLWFFSKKRMRHYFKELRIENIHFNFNAHNNTIKIKFELRDHLFTESCQDLMTKESLEKFFPDYKIETTIEHDY